MVLEERGSLWYKVLYMCKVWRGKREAMIWEGRRIGMVAEFESYSMGLFEFINIFLVFFLKKRKY